MRGNWSAAFLAAAVVVSVSHGAMAAERSSRIETVDLWSWRGQPAALHDAVLTDRAPSRMIPTATAPDAAAKPVPDRQTSQMLSTPMLQQPDDVPDTVKTAWGCIIGGTVGTGVALAANAENLINVIAGGIVTPASPAVLYIGLAGVVFGTFCTLGQAMTPLYIHYFEKPKDDPAGKEVAQSMPHVPAGRTSDVVIDLSGRR